MTNFFGRRLNRGLGPFLEVQGSMWLTLVGFLPLLTALFKRAMNVLTHRLFIRFGGGALLLVCSLNSYAWYNASWNYRVPINVPAGASVNSTIEVNVDFAALLTTLGVVGALDVNSPRVVRSDDLSLSTTQEFTDTLYNGATDAINNGRGEIRFLLQDAGATTYYLYFDIAANGPKAANPQTPINGNFEKGVTGTQNPAGWTATKANGNFDAQVRPSERPSISDADGSPSSVTTDGTPLTGAFSYLLGGRTTAEPVTASPSVTLSRSIVVPATGSGNLVLSYRIEGWDSSEDGASQWDYLRIQLVGSTTTEIVGPAYGNYVTYPFSPNQGTGQISNNSSGYGEYNQWDMDGRGRHRSGMTLTAGSEPWFTRTLALTPYAGQTMMLKITMNESRSYKSWVHIDDVEWSVVTATLGTPVAKSQPLHHIEIQHGSGTGLTCAASTLNIKACLDAACAPYTGGVSGTLNATGAGITANWDGSTGGATGSGFVIPASGSVTKNVQVATAGTVTFGVVTATPTPTNVTVCNFGTNSPTNNNCVFTANSAGFIFSNGSTGNTFTIPAQVSGIATVANALYLRAVQASTTNPAVCSPAIISQTTAVNMGYTCNNPATCQAGSLATITNGTTSAATPIAPGGTAVSLSFDANGSAPITARYDDVGQITLNASKTITPFGGATAVTLTGSSNAFVVAPHHFGFSAITAGPIKAGINFSASVTAYNGLATATPTGNFGKETVPEGVTLSFNKCQPTGAGSSNGSFGGSVSTFNNGAANASNLNWSEVGNGDLVAQLTSSGGYLGSGLTSTGNSGDSNTACKDAGGNPAAGKVGAFIPDHFTTTVIDGCTGCGFTYAAQPFSVTVSAKNGLTTPSTTVNYDGTVNTTPNFANNLSLSDASALASPVGVLGVSASPMGVSVAPVTPATTPPSTTLNVPKIDFNQGVAALIAVPTYSFNTSPTAPTTLKIRAVDAVNPSISSSGFAEGSTEIRSGRIRLPNVYGSELLPLPMVATVQYYNGSYWLTSLTDNVSSFDSNLSTLSPTPGNLLASNASCAVVNAPSAASVSAGVRTLVLARVAVAAPAPKCSTSFSLNSPTYLPSSTGSATFGIYKSPLIYRRENY